MPTFDRGDIVLTPFPFSAGEQFKLRPAIILAHWEYASGTDYLVCAITTQRPADPNLMDLSATDMASGKISERVYIRPLYVYAVDEQEIRRKLGSIKLEKLIEIVSVLTTKLTTS